MVTRVPELLHLVETHAGTLIDHGTDRYGAEHTPLFMATLDPATKRYPEDDTRPDTFVQRAYRFIHAPRGCAAYWDQPTLAAVDLLAGVTGEARYATAVRDYLEFFVERCVSANGLFFWGNHYYWDAFHDRNVEFINTLSPVDQTQPALLHEMRPVFPCWETIYRVDPQAVERAIRAAAEWHVFDDETGGFNRHADKKAGCAFLESGGILSHSLCFLYRHTGDPALLKQALKLARYSFGQRDAQTDLLVNNPTQTRWDSRVTTTEVGLWARALFQGAELIRAGVAGGATGASIATGTNDPPAAVEVATAAAAELREMGRRALGAYLRYGYDTNAQRFYGRLNLDGTPNLEPRETPYMPGEHSSVWEFLFPTHDYPMAMGMAALDCIAGGAGGNDGAGEDTFRQGAARLAGAAMAEIAARPAGQVRYAEHYGRLIVFLTEYARVTGQPRYRRAAVELAEEARRELDRGEMLVGRTGANWYDAIDGVGYLLLALLYLETGDTRALDSF